MNSNQKKCFSDNLSIARETGYGAWQQNDQKQMSTNILKQKEMKTNIKTVMKYVFSFALVCILLIAGGCSHDTEVVNPEVENATGQVETGAEAPWEKVRYDYSYLTPKKVEEANQYLQNQKLSLEDLKQLHDLVNTVFGEYPTKIFDNWEKRNIEIFDKKIFAHEKSRREIYSTILGDFNPIDEKKSIKYYLYDGKGIYLVVDHIGELEDYLYIPFKVWGNNGSDSWLYWTLVVKKTENKEMPWKVYDIASMTEVLGMAPDYYKTAWVTDSEKTVKQLDDSQSLLWNSKTDLTGGVWEYYNGKRTSYPISMRNKSRYTTRSSSNYDNHAVASYSYNYSCQTYDIAHQNDTYCYNNANFPYFYGNDCANFASQCILTGGIPQDNTWSANPTLTYTWKSATALYNYLKNKGYAEDISGREIWDALKNNASSDFQWGDLVFLSYTNNTSVKNHVVIITHSYQHNTDYYNGTPRYTKSGHSQNQRDIHLEKFLNDNNTIGYWGEWYTKNRTMGLHITYGLS